MGANVVDRVYLGSHQVWTSSGGPEPVAYAAARFAGNSAGAAVSAAIGGTGAIDFTIEALVMIEGDRNENASVFNLLFPAGREAILRCSNLFGDGNSGVGGTRALLVFGDSQTGTTGAIEQLVPNTWYLLTLSGDGAVQGSGGLFRATVQELGESTTLHSNTRAKGVESSLAGNGLELNGGPSADGWTNGIRYQHVRAYNSYRDASTLQADLTNADPAGAIFWWQFEDDGEGGLAVTDLTGNNILPTLTNGTLTTGPTL